MKRIGARTDGPTSKTAKAIRGANSQRNPWRRSASGGCQDPSCRPLTPLDISGPQIANAQLDVIVALAEARAKLRSEPRSESRSELHEIAALQAAARSRWI